MMVHHRKEFSGSPPGGDIRANDGSSREESLSCRTTTSPCATEIFQYGDSATRSAKVPQPFT